MTFGAPSLLLFELFVPSWVPLFPWFAVSADLRGVSACVTRRLGTCPLLGAEALVALVADLPPSTARKWLPPPVAGAAGGFGAESGGRDGATACAVMMVLSLPLTASAVPYENKPITL